MKIGGRKCMKNGGRKCIRNGVLKRRVGLALSDTLSTPTGGQKNGEKIKPKNGENFGTKMGIFSYQHACRSRRARRGPLTGRRITVASFGTLNTPAGGVGASSAGRSPFSPAAGAGEAGAGGGAGGVVELISCPVSPPAGLVRTKPRCTLQAHNVAIEEAQHFRKIAVKSVFCEV